MTQKEFSRFLRDPRTGAVLDRMLAENRELDAAIEAQRIKEHNEDVYLRAIRRFFQQ